MKRRYYLIDTENVGDKWSDLPKKARKKDRIITFYTEHHSKHLEGYLTKQIHNPKILWLECTAGYNALDYQLIGVLTYLIAKHPKASFCIYSNDKGYQGTVDFWKDRGIEITQKRFATSKKKDQKKKNGKKKKADTASDLKGLTAEEYMCQIAKYVPTSDLDGWYHCLISVLGEETGRKWYLKIKKDAGLRASLSEYYTAWKGPSRGTGLVALLLDMHGLDVTQAEEAYKIIQAHNRKNTKAIKEDLDKRFGTRPPQGYYKVLRPLLRVIKDL